MSPSIAVSFSISQRMRSRRITDTDIDPFFMCAGSIPEQDNLKSFKIYNMNCIQKYLCLSLSLSDFLCLFLHCILTGDVPTVYSPKMYIVQTIYSTDMSQLYIHQRCSNCIFNRNVPPVYLLEIYQLHIHQRCPNFIFTADAPSIYSQ